MRYLKKSFNKMEPYFSKNIIDGIILNANEAPYLPPIVIIEKFNNELKDIRFNRYPDMQNLRLVASIAQRHKINDENVICGVGSDELLESAFKAVLEVNDNVLSFSPSFSMYKVFADLELANFISVDFNLDMSFNVDKMIEKINEYNPKLVLICSPNNPTGAYLLENDVRRIIEATEGLVILDLAYIDFAVKDYYYLALEYENVIAFKTFSKAMALPSIRVGYAISNKENIDMLKAIKAPYSVSMISEIIASIAIDNKELYFPLIEEIKENRNYLYNELKKNNFIVYPSEANFLYLKLDINIFNELEKNKIYIRSMKNGFYRISIGTKEEIDELLRVVLKYA